MADITIKKLDEFDSYGGQFIYAGKGLGVTSWGMNVLKLPARWDGYPDHDHQADGQEEAYVVLSGDATLHAGGQTWRLEAGTCARVGAGEKRKIVPGENGVTLLALGGTPGKAFTARAGGDAADQPVNPPPGYSRITPYLNYEDTGAMMEWLGKAFGMVERHAMRAADGTVNHAEMTLEGAVVMMGSPGKGFRNPKHLGQTTHSLYIYIDDVDRHCEHARSAGAEIIEEPADQPYGDRRYGVCDPEGHRWYFASRRAAAPGMA